MLADCKGKVKVMMSMRRVPHSLSTRLLPQFRFFVMMLMFLTVLSCMGSPRLGSPRLGGMRCRGTGVLCVGRRLWASVCLDPRVGWIPLDLHGFYKWVFDALGLPNEFVKQVVVHGRWVA